MTREQMIARAMAHGPDETRRLALDKIDENARSTSTWGAADHRKARDKVEQTYTEERTAMDRLSDEQLEAL
ncbi:hypothetical protein AYO38_09835 [bacterium SCGC AG-212-C10]|nr:hypothetical protein AYO38_09835 [bacterium SCGC AG-212-C10]